MKLNEVLNENEHWDPEQADYRTRDDVRAPSLTLRHLSKLRKMREVQRLEKLKDNEFISAMFGGGEEEDSGMDL